MAWVAVWVVVWAVAKVDGVVLKVVPAAASAISKLQSRRELDPSLMEIRCGGRGHFARYALHPRSLTDTSTDPHIVTVPLVVAAAVVATVAVTVAVLVVAKVVLVVAPT